MLQQMNILKYCFFVFSQQEAHRTFTPATQTKADDVKR